MARFDGPIYPQLGPKILGIRALKVHNGQCDLQWKKYLWTYFFPLSISYFISDVITKKTAYKWTTPAEEAFLAEAVSMGLRRKSILLGGKCDLFPGHLIYRRL
jgi:hypothetical protein